MSGSGFLLLAATTPMPHRCHQNSIDASSVSLASRFRQVPGSGHNVIIGSSNGGLNAEDAAHDNSRRAQLRAGHQALVPGQ
jgi:hypothetical protein